MNVDEWREIDEIASQVSRARGRAEDLCRAAVSAIGRARATARAVARSRRASATRRLLRLAAGASDAGEAPPLRAVGLPSVRELAVSILRADPGMWYCLACWQAACGIPGADGHSDLRSIALGFARAPRRPGAFQVDLARCQQQTHPPARSGANLCVRIAV